MTRTSHRSHTAPALPRILRRRPEPATNVAAIAPGGHPSVLLSELSLGRLVGAGGEADVLACTRPGDPRDLVVRLVRDIVGDVEVHAPLDVDLDGISPVVAAVRDHDRGSIIGWLHPRFTSGDLHDVLGTRGATPAEIASWVARLARSLLSLHVLGHVHGDVSPANVCLDADGGAWLVDATPPTSPARRHTPGVSPASDATPAAADDDRRALLQTIRWCRGWLGDTDTVLEEIAHDDLTLEEIATRAEAIATRPQPLVAAQVEPSEPRIVAPLRQVTEIVGPSPRRDALPATGRAVASTRERMAALVGVLVLMLVSLGSSSPTIWAVLNALPATGLLAIVAGYRPAGTDGRSRGPAWLTSMSWWSGQASPA